MSSIFPFIGLHRERGSQPILNIPFNHVCMGTRPGLGKNEGCSERANPENTKRVGSVHYYFCDRCSMKA